MKNEGIKPIYIRIKPEYVEKLDSIKNKVKTESNIKLTNTATLYYAIDQELKASGVLTA